MLRRVFILLLLAGVAGSVPLPAIACPMQGAMPCSSQGPAHMACSGCPVGPARIACHCTTRQAPMAALPAPAAPPVPAFGAKPLPLRVTDRAARASKHDGSRGLAPPASRARLCIFLI